MRFIKKTFCPCIRLRGRVAQACVAGRPVWGKVTWGLVSYFEFAQMMSSNALLEHQVVMCVKHDILLAVCCYHRSAFDQYLVM